MGAPESNAGDDFHFWWAATRALGLVKPGAESTVVTLEGLSRVDDPDDQYEAVDVGVYIGGDSLVSASSAVLSQLKYSTRHPDKAWTAGRLREQRTRRGRDGRVVSRRSVIADLAGVYAQLLQSHPREELLRKVQISASRETVSKALADFVARGWLLLSAKSVLIVNPERLRARAR